MPKIEPVNMVTPQGSFNRITSDQNYWGVGYDDNNLIIVMTVYNEEGEFKGAIQGGTVTDGNLNAFGWVGDYADFISEINNEGLTYPS